MELYIVTCLFLQIFAVQTLIVPDEIPSILSVVYSNIPAVKKGTDSRLGWGFRLGDRADFQVLVELGPQKYTQPLANEEDKNTNKRNTIDNLSNTLYAQRLRDKQIQKEREVEVEDTDGGKWLQAWSASVKQRSSPDQQKLPPGAKPGLAEGEIDAKSVIPDDKTLKLIEIYQKKIQDNSRKIQELKDRTGVGEDVALRLAQLYQQQLAQSAQKSDKELDNPEGVQLSHVETTTLESESTTECIRGQESR